MAWSLEFYLNRDEGCRIHHQKKGVWYLTDDGADAITQSPETFYKKMHELYLAWDEKRRTNTIHSCELDLEHPEANESKMDQIEADANQGIVDYIMSKDPYDFQDLVGALLRGMGYYTPFIAPKGRDGGIDIIAYSDSLGASVVRLKVQVKHYAIGKVGPDVVRKLQGQLHDVSDVGLIVTSGQFTTEASREARHSPKKIRLIDMNELIQLWVKYYNNLNEEDKARLPLIPIYYLNTQ